MNYGHTNSAATPDAPLSLQNSRTQQTPESLDTPANNLNLENWGAVSDQAPALHREPIVGPTSEQSPIHPLDHSAVHEEASPSDPLPMPGDPPSALGEIVPLSAAPTSAVAMPTADAIRADGDRISNATLEAIDTARAALSQTGDLGAFYDQIRDLGRTYRHNSFGVEKGTDL